MRTSTVTIASSDGGRFSAYLSLPPQERAPGLVLIQYICGVNRVMRSLADGFAAQGYAVLVPDLYWRQQPGVSLLDDPTRPDAAQQQRALDLNDGFDDERGIDDLRATLAFLRNHPGCNGRAGALGYCLGGRLAYLMATRTDVDCAVGYYGVKIEQHLDEADRIRRPLMLHMAGADYLVPEPTRQQITRRLEQVPGVAVMVHPGVNHAFALPGGANWSAEAADRANQASLAFLREHLASATTAA